MPEVEKKDSNKNMMALAALMFFSPFIHYVSTKRSLSSEENEKKFIRWYIKLGYLNLLFLLLAIAAGIGDYLLHSAFLQVMYTICIGIVLLILLVWTICILSNVSLTIGKTWTLTYYDIGERKSVIVKFLPLYNVYLRYALHEFWTPNRWLKESLLWRTFFVLLALTGHPIILSVIIVLLILRVATLTMGIDVLHLQTKMSINNLFTKNPEEIRWYVTGFVLFLLKGLWRMVRTSATPLSLHDCIEGEKIAYSRLYNITQSRTVRMEYLFALGLGFLYRYLIQPDMTQWTWYVPLALIAGRYLIMLFAWKHLPSIPVARELRLLVTFLIIQPFRFLFMRSRHAQVQS